jgi:hypothetical protein
MPVHETYGDSAITFGRETFVAISVA